jgi:hypothetical protein
MTPSDEQLAAEPWSLAPTDLADVPGLVGDLVRYITETARYPDRLMALAAALSIVGKLLDRKVIGPTSSGTLLWMLILAFTGAGKEHLLNCISAALDAAEEGDKIGPSDFASVQATQEAVEEQSSFIAIMDEFGSFVARITSGSQSSDVQEITGTLCSLYGKEPGSKWKGPKKKGKEVATVWWPALSIFGASTPSQFYEAIKSKLIATGFLNRFLIVSIGKGGARAIPKRDWRDIPGALKNKLKAVSKGPAPSDLILEMGGTPVEWRRVGWGVGAEARFNEFDDKIRALPDGVERDVQIRVALNAIRVATIVAVGRGSASVELADLEWALSLASASATRLLEDLSKYSREQLLFGDLCDKILSVIRRAGGFVLRPALLTALKSNIRGMKDVDDAIAYLCQSQQIAVASPKGGVAGYQLMRVD